MITRRPTQCKIATTIIAKTIAAIAASCAAGVATSGAFHQAGFLLLLAGLAWISDQALD